MIGNQTWTSSASRSTWSTWQPRPLARWSPSPSTRSPLRLARQGLSPIWHAVIVEPAYLWYLSNHYCHRLHNYLPDHPHGWHIQFWHYRPTKPQNHHWYKKIYKNIVNQHKSCQSCHDPRLTRSLVSSLLSSMPWLIENHFPSKLYQNALYYC